MKQRGNILFLILLAVVLFAALSYAVTSSLRGGGQDAGKEKATLYASQLIQNVSAIESQMMRARLVDNIPDYGFNFRGTGTVASLNSTCTKASCHIFSSEGGGVPDFQIDPDMSSDSSSASNLKAGFYMVSIQNVSTSAAELVVRYTRISDALCNAINEVLGLEVDLSVPDAYGTPGLSSYSGTLTELPADNGALIGDAVTSVAGHKTFCFYNAASSGNNFIHVLLER